ncbi:MAG: NTP transferase domain-containing protein [Clostridia bacterium]|nr:NTP transferase domain-containing protein [Clostridia bacterium]
MNNPKICAVILAGGFGSRLRPITDTLPKPLTKILDRPVMSYALDMIKNCGAIRAYVTTRYLAEKISEHFGENYGTISLHYNKEETPLGTAGSVAAALGGVLDDYDCFLVLSGDAVCDFDLNPAIAFHIKNGNDATIVSYRKNETAEYGTIRVEKDGDNADMQNGKILSFIEKPPLSQSYSDLVNTGIYILSKKAIEKIPEGEYDFGKELFPKMLADGDRLFSYEASGYWCDIGKISEYRRCLCDIMRRKNLENYIDPSAEIAEDCDISQRSVLEKGTKVGKGCDIEASVLLENCKIGGGCKITNAIICENCVIEEGCVVPSGCIIGGSCRIRKNTVLMPNTQIESGKEIGSDGFYEDENIPFSGTFPALQKDGFCGEFYYEFDFSFAVSLGRAAASLENVLSVGIYHDGEKHSENIARAIALGVLECGKNAVIYRDVFDGGMVFCAKADKNGLLFHISSFCKRIYAKIYDENGVFPTRDIENKIISALQKKPKCASFCGKIIEKDDFITRYQRAVFEKYKSIRLDGMKIRLRSNAVSHILGEMLSKSGANVRYEGQRQDMLCLDISDDGKELFASRFENGRIYQADRCHIAAAVVAFLGAKILYLPGDCLFGIERVVEKRGCRVLRFGISAQNADTEEGDARKKFYLNSYLFDALELAFVFSACVFAQSFENTLKELPQFEVFSDSVKVKKGDRCFVMKSLYDMPENKQTAFSQKEGVGLEFEHGKVHVMPYGDGVFSIVSDAECYETAKELADITKEKIEKLIAKRREK